MHEKVAYERRPVTSPEALIGLVKETLKKNLPIVIATDFDDTVSQVGVSGGESPFDTMLHPNIGRALTRLAHHGVILGVISNRAGEQIVQRYHQAGIRNVSVVGSYGMESLSQTEDPAKRELIIHPQLTPYKEIITRTLGEVRSALYEVVGQSKPQQPVVETTIATGEGPVYIEVKGQNADFPEGLAQVYNFNSMLPARRKEILDKLTSIYNHSLEALDTLDPNEKDHIRDIWGIPSSSDNPQQEGRYSWELRPLGSRGKGFGLVTLLRGIQQTGVVKKPVGIILFAGDSNRDASAMHAGKMLERITHGKTHAVDIWVRPSNQSEPDVEQESDFSVNGVEGFANLLTMLAQTVERHTRKSFFPGIFRRSWWLQKNHHQPQGVEEERRSNSL